MLDYTKLTPLAAAFARFSGGTVIPDVRHDLWQRLVALLEEANADPHEYAYWLVFVQSAGQYGATANWDITVLEKRNIVCSLGYVERFLEWRRKHAETVPLIVRSQRAYVATTARPLAETLMDDTESLGALVRCELALEQLDNEDERDAVLARYGMTAQLVLHGVPAYRYSCPKMTALWEQKLRGGAS